MCGTISKSSRNVSPISVLDVYTGTGPQDNHVNLYRCLAADIVACIGIRHFSPYYTWFRLDYT